MRIRCYVRPYVRIQSSAKTFVRSTLSTSSLPRKTLVIPAHGKNYPVVAIILRQLRHTWRLAYVGTRGVRTCRYTCCLPERYIGGRKVQTGRAFPRQFKIALTHISTDLPFLKYYTSSITRGSARIPLSREESFELSPRHKHRRHSSEDRAIHLAVHVLGRSWIRKPAH